LIPGDSGATGQRARNDVALTIRLAAQDGPGALEQEEAAVADCVGWWDARVRICSLPVTKGAVVLVKDAEGGLQTRAEVRHILIGADGNPRVDLAFLDAPAPKRLHTDGEAEEHKQP
jgi:hypothetical protein